MPHPLVCEGAGLTFPDARHRTECEPNDCDVFGFSLRTASEGGPLYLGSGRNLLKRRVSLAGRPSGPEAGSANSMSLFCRSAPRPNFLKLKRITGRKSLHLQGQLEIAQGRGARVTAYCKEA